MELYRVHSGKPSIGRDRIFWQAIDTEVSMKRKDLVAPATAPACNDQSVIDNNAADCAEQHTEPLVVYARSTANQ